MTIKEAKEWLTEERLDRINGDRARTGEEPASKEMMARMIALLDTWERACAMSRYE